MPDARGEHAEGEDPDVSEAQSSRGLKAPETPSAEERAEHNRTHLPYRAWCDECVAARARADNHSSKPKEEDRYKIPQLCLDYWFLGRRGPDERDGSPVIVLYKL